MVNVDAHEPIADRTMYECGCDGRVNATRECTKHAIGGANLRGDCGDRIFGNAPGSPVSRCLRDVVDKVAQQSLPPRGVHHLGMELDPPQVAGCISECGERRGVGVGDGVESGWCLGDGVTVAHPDTSASVLGRNASQQQIRLVADANVGGAVLTS